MPNLHSTLNDALNLDKATAKMMALHPKLKFRMADPFHYKEKQKTFFQKYIQPFGTFLLFPIRLIGALASLAFTNVWAQIAMFGYRPAYDDEGHLRPLSTWRKYAFYPAVYSFRAFLACLGFHYIQVKGKPASKEEAPIVVANHISILEPLVIGLLHIPMIVAKNAMRYYPGFANLLYATQSILVDRKNPNSRIDCINDITYRTNHPEFPQLLIFPEGTTHDENSLIHFKRGAFIPGLPVQPIVVRYPNNGFNPTYTVRGPSLPRMMLRCLMEPYNNIELEYLPVYYPSEAEKADPDLYASNVQKVMANAMVSPLVTSHSYFDHQLLTHALKKNPSIHLNTSLNHIHAQLTQNPFQWNRERNDYYELMDSFATLDKSMNSCIDRNDYFDAYQSKASLDSLERAYQHLDVDNTNCVDFHDFVLRMAPYYSKEDGLLSPTSAIDSFTADHM